MKIKEEFVYFGGCDEPLLIPVGKEVERLRNVAVLSKAAGYLIRMMKQDDYSIEELEEFLISEYNVDTETAKKDVREFFNELEKYGITE